jgi:hypothetical protein
MKPATGGFLVAIVLSLAGCGGDEDGDASGRPSTPPAPETGPGGAVIVPLVEENDSGASGTATLTGAGRASVTIELDGSDELYRAHVHDVSCERYRRMDDFNAQLATLSEGLISVTDGRSKSELSQPLSSYTKAGYSINVHESAAPYPVVACGDLSAP